MEAKSICPLMGCECIKDGAIKDGVLVKCRFWINIMGKHPQSGETLNTWDCSFAWMPILMIDNTNINRQTGAAIETLRNENVSVGQLIAGALVGAAAAKNQLGNGGQPDGRSNREHQTIDATGR